MKKTDIIKTKSGKIQGYQDDSLKIFKGIPYAAPPIGNLRFKPPVETKPWRDVLNTTTFGPYSPQGFTALEEMFGKFELQGEDNCLTLNIWTPALDNLKRPVMVYIHGGSFVFGGGADIWYGVGGSELAHKGDIVVVTLNYRLGAFGFLYIPDLIANAGNLDQVAALRWIHENIEVFGGDPENITIFGESAGGLSVITLLSMPSSKGLFHRAIAQSVPILDSKPTIKSTDNLFKELGVASGDVETLQKLPASKIIEVQDKIIERGLTEGTNEIMDFRPSIDGKIIPMHPIEALHKGIGSDIDLIIGTNLDEVNLWTVEYPEIQNLDFEGLQKTVNERLSRLGLDSNLSLNLIKSYKGARKNLHPTSPIDLYNAIDTDFTFRIPTIRIAEAQCIHNPNTYNYLFTWPSPALEGRYGSCHIVEIPFVFGTIGKTGVEWFYGEGKEAELLSKRMMESWIAFARTGNPNHDQIPKWPSYDVTYRSAMLIGNEFKVVEDPFGKERAAWEDII